MDQQEKMSTSKQRLTLGHLVRVASVCALEVFNGNKIICADKSMKKSFNPLSVQTRSARKTGLEGLNPCQKNLE